MNPEKADSAKGPILFMITRMLYADSKLALPAEDIGEGNGTPLQYSCLENPMDGGAWWAAVHEESDTTERLHFHALEKEMATPSSVLAWRIPGSGGAWWAAVYGVPQSWTQLMRLSSSRRHVSESPSG